MDFSDQLNRRIEENKTEMLSSLSKLISIRSVANEERGMRPFGEGVQKVYEEMLAMAHSDGFAVCNVDNYGGHIFR